ncbi:MAG: protein-glutamate O-methyltransferase CheR [Planctomycetota bacterium]
MPTSKAQMNDEQFRTLREIIYKRAGIHFPDGKKYVLESRLGHRLGELEVEDYDQYIMLLTMGPYQKDEFQEMFNRITINETSFFRNEPQLNVFERKVLPQLLEDRKTTRRLRIWSAACSSGEEPFTLAMIIHRSLGSRLADWNIEILGTDISEKALGTAQSGAYTSYAVRSTPDLVKRRYFTEEKNLWILDEQIRKMVAFETHNLKDRLAAKRFGAWDVIFCRNVMIYFDDQMKDEVVGTFHQQLTDDGYLFIGHSESIRGQEHRFTQLPHAQGFAYQRNAGAVKAAA